MKRVRFKGNEFETEHEAICSALFDKYGWRWERSKHPIDGWLPDFRLRGDTDVLVECKGGLEWDDVRNLSRAALTSADPALWTQVPNHQMRRVKNRGISYVPRPGMENQALSQILPREQGEAG